MNPFVDEKARPPYPQFETRAEVDKKASEEQGHVVFKDIDYIVLTMPGGKQVFDAVAVDFFYQKEKMVIAGTYPKDWLQFFKQAFDEWKKGNEIPVSGTAIKHWPVATPAEIAQLAAADVKTVEDLAEANESTLQVIGMGARVLRDKARTWLQSASDKGVLVERIANLEEELRRRDERIDTLNERLQRLEQSQDRGKKAA